ncbi:MAG: GTPase HflX [Firmicutes bacterium]|nr:GTPase HflX [Bacillota bacterium]
MKIYDNTLQPDNAILVGVGISETICEQSLDELAGLCASCNILDVGRIVQNRKDIDVTYFVGKGKVDEIKTMVEQNNANVVVFDVELSGSKQRNLERELGVPVLDRSKIILDIFAQRAQSMEGQLQVELAQLKYLMPRLIGSQGLMSKMKNAVGMRGPGEKKLEMDRRKIKDEIIELERRLKKVAQNRIINRQSAIQGGKPRIALVGYTNSGKSTLLNTLTKAGIYAEDQLFATLDPKTANLYIPPVLDNENFSQKGLQCLLTDTVGFIDKLPHEFIKAFESTLDEARYANLLLHVVDISNTDYQQQINVVNSVLEKINACNVKTILVLNKIDNLSTIGIEILGREFKNYNFVTVSAKKNIGIDNLKNAVLNALS